MISLLIHLDLPILAAGAVKLEDVFKSTKENMNQEAGPERLIALIAGATFNLLTPVMALLAVLTNVTALQRILYTRKIARDTALR